MINPLNELSDVYNQNIAEGCGCDEKKKDKIVLKGSSSVDGGDAAKPGKDRNYVKPMATEGHCEEEGVKCSPVEKKKDSKKSVKENFYSDWRGDLAEYVDVADSDNAVKSSPKTDTEAQKEIKEKKVRNKIKINPPQGVTEGFRELGGVVVEMYELTEADMTGAPSIKDAKPAKKVNVKYDPKMKVMAPQINKEETEEEKKKREMQAKTKEHDDKMAGKLAEQSGGGLSKLGPRESDKRKDKGKKKPQAIRQSKARLAALKRRLNSEELSIKDQMRISREAAKNRNPNPDHKAIRGKMLKKPLPKDTRTDAQKMTDATGPRPGSNYRGD